jgi:hypothetical protein
MMWFETGCCINVPYEKGKKGRIVFYPARRHHWFFNILVCEHVHLHAMATCKMLLYQPFGFEKSLSNQSRRKENRRAITHRSHSSACCTIYPMETCKPQPGLSRQKSSPETAHHGGVMPRPRFPPASSHTDAPALHAHHIIVILNRSSWHEATKPEAAGSTLARASNSIIV